MDARIPLPPLPDSDLDPTLSQDAVDELVENVELGLHTLMLGPRGCGKTVTAQLAAQRLVRPIEVFHLGAVFDAEAAVAGSMTLRGGETRFVRSRFVHAVTKPGTLILLDELNRAPAEVHNALLSLLDFQSEIALDLDSEASRIVRLADGVVFVSTANQGAEYVGTEPLDAALLDRMAFIRMDYPANEDRLLVREGLNALRARRLVKKARRIREQYARGALPASISTRRLVCVARLVARGHGLEESFRRNVPVFDEKGVAALLATLRGEK